MINIHGFITSKPVDDAITFGYPDKPVYVRLPDGTLHEIDYVRDGQIALKDGSGMHDVIVIDVSKQSSTEA